MTPETIYDEDGITVIHGDCRDVIASLRYDRVITDPPYGHGHYPTDVTIESTLLRSLYDTSDTLAVFGYPETLVRWIIAAPLPTPDEWVTWWPTNGHVYGAPRLLPRESEHIAIFGDVPGATRLRRPRSESVVGQRITAERGKDVDTTRLGDVWRDAAPGRGFQIRDRRHPNEKPVKTMRKLIELTTEPGDMILDPFAGSGSVLVAARELGRRAIGIELDATYCDTIIRRFAQTALPVYG